LSTQQISILKTLAYFDMFQYPISKEEISQFTDQPVDEATLKETVTNLVSMGMLFEIDGFLSLHNDPSLVERRKAGNLRAKSLLQTAYRIAGFLHTFPFVRGVGISGSLSKNFADEDADIDFFIITQSNRLWLARTFMHLFKKLTFLSGKQHWYCMNYYIDEDALVINEKNIYTATEVVTLIPVCGDVAFRNFYSANDWGYACYPNQQKNPICIRSGNKSFRVKKAIESLFNNRLGDWLDNYWMNLTTKRWVRKENRHQLNIKGGFLGLKTGKHFARPNPDYFQKKIMLLYDAKLKELKIKWNIHFE